MWNLYDAASVGWSLTGYQLAATCGWPITSAPSSVCTKPAPSRPIGTPSYATLTRNFSCLPIALCGFTLSSCPFRVQVARLPSTLMPLTFSPTRSRLNRDSFLVEVAEIVARPDSRSEAGR